jgi:hypothetical protein
MHLWLDFGIKSNENFFITSLSPPKTAATALRRPIQPGKGGCPMIYFCKVEF